MFVFRVSIARAVQLLRKRAHAITGSEFERALLLSDEDLTLTAGQNRRLGAVGPGESGAKLFFEGCEVNSTWNGRNRANSQHRTPQSKQIVYKMFRTTFPNCWPDSR